MLKLEQERLKRPWTLEYVAKMLETTKSTICDYEKGRSKPSYEKLVKLEDLFGESHRWLFTVANDDKAKLSL